MAKQTVKLSVRITEDEAECLERWRIEKERKGKKSSLSDQVSLCIVLRRISEEKKAAKA